MADEGEIEAIIRDAREVQTGDNLARHLLFAWPRELPGERMGFVREAFLALAPLAPPDLRPGASVSGALAAALRQALADAARVIANMPARHLTYADDRTVFPTGYGRIPAASDSRLG